MPFQFFFRIDFSALWQQGRIVDFEKHQFLSPFCTSFESSNTEISDFYSKNWKEYLSNLSWQQTTKIYKTKSPACRVHQITAISESQVADFGNLTWPWELDLNQSCIFFLTTLISIILILEWSQFILNYASKLQFTRNGENKSIYILDMAFYSVFKHWRASFSFWT